MTMKVGAGHAMTGWVPTQRGIAVLGIAPWA